MPTGRRGRHRFHPAPLLAHRVQRTWPRRRSGRSSAHTGRTAQRAFARQGPARSIISTILRRRPRASAASIPARASAVRRQLARCVRLELPELRRRLSRHCGPAAMAWPPPFTASRPAARPARRRRDRRRTSGRSPCRSSGRSRRLAAQRSTSRLATCHHPDMPAVASTTRVDGMPARSGRGSLRCRQSPVAPRARSRGVPR